MSVNTPKIFGECIYISLQPVFSYVVVSLCHNCELLFSIIKKASQFSITHIHHNIFNYI